MQPMTNIKLGYVKIFDNSQTGSNISTDNIEYVNSESLNIITEDGTGCVQLLSDSVHADHFWETINNGTHFTMTNSEFRSNTYNSSTIDIYCSIITIENTDFIDNYGGLASGIHSDAGHVF